MFKRLWTENLNRSLTHLRSSEMIFAGSIVAAFCYDRKTIVSLPFYVKINREEDGDVFLRFYWLLQKY